MKISEFKYSEIRLPFATPLHTSSRSYKERRSFIISIKDEKGTTGWGEAAPLPTFGREDYPDTLNGINFLAENLKNEDIIFDDLLKDNPEWRNNLTPSLMFALDQALTGVLLRGGSIQPAGAFTLTRETIYVNGLLGIKGPEDSEVEIRRLVKDGYRSLKVKIGRQEFKEDLKIIELVRTLAGKGISIRLDVNGGWSIGDAVRNIAQLKKYNIEYIEEPVNNLGEMTELSRSSDIPIAFDESLYRNVELIDTIESVNPGVLILKPSLAGGLREFMKILALSNRRGIKVVVSSIFESSIGRSFLVFLASLTNSRYAHGLGSAGFLLKEPADDPYEPRRGKIEFYPDSYPPNFNFRDDFHI